MWAATGECEANPGFMKHSCRISCNTCIGSKKKSLQPPPAQVHPVGQDKLKLKAQHSSACPLTAGLSCWDTTLQSGYGPSSHALAIGMQRPPTTVRIQTAEHRVKSTLACRILLAGRQGMGSSPCCVASP